MITHRFKLQMGTFFKHSKYMTLFEIKFSAKDSHAIVLFVVAYQHSSFVLYFYYYYP